MASNDAPPNNASGCAPSSSPSETESYTSLGDFTVDGETFSVLCRESHGSFHYNWISGPNDGYGFSVSRGVGRRSHARHLADIREFLSNICEASGHL